MDDVLEPEIPQPQQIPQDVQETAAQLLHPSRPPVAHTHCHHSNISDQDLDDLIILLRIHFRRAGIRMIHGMLLRLGHRVQQVRIRESLLRIDPVRRVFERIRIRRRKYSVAGPNALWHHDGQHGSFPYSNHSNNVHPWVAGLIRWGLIIHGFIDGYSRLITGLQASSNNTGHTVLTLFSKCLRHLMEFLPVYAETMEPKTYLLLAWMKNAVENAVAPTYGEGGFIPYSTHSTSGY